MCSFTGCDRPLSNKGGSAEGLCTAHWMQRKRGGELKPLRSRRPTGHPDVPQRKATPQIAAMRKWLKANGYVIGDTGKIPKHMQEAFFEDSV